MKVNGILNSDISRVLSYMGHTDRLAIGDCGLPVPEETERIDLALTFGKPSFMEVLKTVAQDMRIEGIVLAEEIKKENPELHDEIQKFFSECETGFFVKYVSHQELKEMTKDCKAVIRTGEITPYANIILQSACIFA
ncbi:MAG: D-ribose pyranase [Eubacteriales bacterium]|nr:D-ribose pyranase [Eubacteriales bacterium]